MNAQTIGELKKTNYKPKSVKQELRENLITALQSGEKVFEGIHGFEHTVIPDLERAILSRHSILLLGLRGQAKTRIARLLITLLDEYIPVIEGSEINDDPINPVSRHAKELIAKLGDKTPISWMHREERYIEKLATPDVTVADLIGDVDPIKAATLKLPYSDERVIHYGLVPRAHRSIFVVNELPDLQARIQVSLFNILQESDLQIRGFTFRLPLDIQFVFTANPEDYTNRGSIITPLKDRIESQIITHYPVTLDIAEAITKQEADLTKSQSDAIFIPKMVSRLLERISFEARESEYVDEKSGVSARLSISGLENLVSSAERRILKNSESKTIARISDFWGVIPAITGKIELVYEGELEGPYNVALKLLGAAIRKEFLNYFPHPDKKNKSEENDPYGTIKAWFSSGKTLEIPNDCPEQLYDLSLKNVAGLEKLVNQYKIPKKEQAVYMELVLHGLAEFNQLNKEFMDFSLSFSDILADMWNDMDEDDDGFD
jgi:magnesium chelatase subunit I